MLRRLSIALAFALLGSLSRAADAPLSFQQTLAREPVAELAKDARSRGDAGRGAVLFFQPFLTCAKCHDGDTGTQLGPDLTKVGNAATAEHLIESVLLPSKVIQKGYESVVFQTTDGRTLTGIVVEEKDGRTVGDDGLRPEPDEHLRSRWAGTEHRLQGDRREARCRCGRDLAGQTAPEGRRMGHAGALTEGGKGTAAGKIAALRAAGIEVAETPADLGAAVKRAMDRKKYG